MCWSRSAALQVLHGPILTPAARSARWQTSPVILILAPCLRVPLRPRGSPCHPKVLCRLQPRGPALHSPTWQTIPFPGETAHNSTATLGKTSTTVGLGSISCSMGKMGPKLRKDWDAESWIFTGLGCRDVKYLWCFFCFCPSIQKLTYRYEFQN